MKDFYAFVYAAVAQFLPYYEQHYVITVAPLGYPWHEHCRSYTAVLQDSRGTTINWTEFQF